ncbi:hypothetical protein Mal15_44430 [Stieleria maiorica]|uniref:Uncharacterized protein n=1 Tax=Stieleria maiorica TaxID=2795974 RepID=A0A5B9MGH6_9BACT|nr:hypothetical protein Mal15_44430 [Stieleria maiorica]
MIPPPTQPQRVAKRPRSDSAGEAMLTVLFKYDGPSGPSPLGFVPHPVAEAAKAFVSQRFTREKPKFLANSATTYDPCRV